MNYTDPNSLPQTSSSESIADSATQAWKTTTEKAGEALQTGERYVRDNPATSALSIFGLGVVIGLVIGWSVAHEERDDYSAAARKLGKRWGQKLNFL